MTAEVSWDNCMFAGLSYGFVDRAGDAKLQSDFRPVGLAIDGSQGRLLKPDEGAALAKILV